jgi:hypothetical protein
MAEDRRREGRSRCQMNQDQCTKGARGYGGASKRAAPGGARGARGLRGARRPLRRWPRAYGIQTASPHSRSELSPGSLLRVETAIPWLCSMKA